MKRPENEGKKPNRVKEIFDRMNEQKASSQQTHGKGKHSSGGKGPGKGYSPKPRSAKTQNWHRPGNKKH